MASESGTLVSNGMTRKWGIRVTQGKDVNYS